MTMPQARAFPKAVLPVLFVFLWIFCPGLYISETAAADRPFGIALLGDPHLPGKELPTKDNILRTINGWDDIDRVVVLGDICKETGTASEYAAAKEFFSRLQKPLRLVAGNHDYIYEDETNNAGRREKGSPAARRSKLV
jgi:predicted MPP superfamily phosphohydrolase